MGSNQGDVFDKKKTKPQDNIPLILIHSVIHPFIYGWLYTGIIDCKKECFILA